MRMVLTETDVQRHINTLAAPFETKASLGQFTKEDAKAAVGTPVPKPDDYKDRLLKYIPAEVVALYLTLDGIIKAATGQLSPREMVWAGWIIFAALLVLTPVYLLKMAGVTKKLQLFVSTLAFAVWIFALPDGIFKSLSWYRPVFGALVLPLYTFLVPMIYKGD